jgi:hypothetical protein
MSRDSKSSQSSPLFKILNFVKIFFKTKGFFYSYIIQVLNLPSENFSLFLFHSLIFPLHFNVIKAMIRYYDRFKKIEEMFPLLHAAYKESISIDDSNRASWFSSIK